MRDTPLLAGLMQSHPLTIGSLVDHAARHHGGQEVIGRRADGGITRSNWQAVGERARRVGAALHKLGLAPGDRVATLAWNRLPHLELYFGVPGAGFILHTVNPRLHAEHLDFILRDGGARVLCVDPDLFHLVEPLLGRLPEIEHVIVLCAADEMPGSAVPGLLAYDAWLAEAEPLAEWPRVEEEAGSTLCYTSGTTGDPKGVLYTHRSTVLHAMQACMADSMALSARDSIALVTPLFHVNAWGVPFAAAICGAKLALPGSALDPASLLDFMATEGATFALGVPTVWLGFVDHVARLDEAERPALALTRLFMGGSAPPPTLIEAMRETLGIDVIHAWGMTETSPVMTVSRPLAHQQALTPQQMIELQSLQGRLVFGADMRLVGEDGQLLPNDGVAAGVLQVRGHWVLRAYFGKDVPATDPHGWFDTGDIAQITPDGFLRITDRAKDVIKSGGEWISSIDLENAAQAHPSVAQAAVIGAVHPRWQERPLLLVRLQPGISFDRAAIMEHLAGAVARWWLPDDIIVVDELPHSATGKVLKNVLRERYGQYLMTNL